MPVAPPIGPRPSDARAFDLALSHVFLNPTIRDLNARIRDAHRSYDSIRDAIDAVRAQVAPAGLAQITTTTRAHLRRIEAGHKRRFHRVMRRYLGVRVDFLSDAHLGPLMQTAIADSVDLIVTIPPRLHGALKVDLERLASTAPFDEQLLRQTLAKNYDSAGYNLRRLTRDQSSKLVGRLNEARQTQVGIDDYKWLIARDASVRPTHRANSGKTFRWDRPPSVTGLGSCRTCRRCSGTWRRRPGPRSATWAATPCGAGLTGWCSRTAGCC